MSAETPSSRSARWPSGRTTSGTASAARSKRAVLGAADALGDPLAPLLGHPAYYRRFGFELSTVYQIIRPGRNGSRTSRFAS